MKISEKIKIWFNNSVRTYKLNRNAKKKEIAYLIRRINEESETAKERSQGISVRLSQLKMAVKKIRESRKNVDKAEIDKAINELRTMLCEMANAGDHNTKTTAHKFDIINTTEIKQNDRIDAFESMISEFKKEMENVFKHERNMRKIIGMQDALLQHRKEFEKHADDLREKMKLKRDEYLKEFEEHSMSIRAIDGQFRNAMALQCQDILRRVNQQLSPQHKPIANDPMQNQNPNQNWHNNQ